MTNLTALKQQIDHLESRVSQLENLINSKSFAEDAAWLDQLYQHAKELVIKHRRASATFLQRKLLIDYERACKLLVLLQDNGIIGPATGEEPRQVLADP